MSQPGHRQLEHLPLGRIRQRVLSQFWLGFAGPWDILQHSDTDSDKCYSTTIDKSDRSILHKFHKCTNNIFSGYIMNYRQVEGPPLRSYLAAFMEAAQKEWAYPVATERTTQFCVNWTNDGRKTRVRDLYAWGCTIKPRRGKTVSQFVCWYSH